MICRNGFVTTDQIRRAGYAHPPRAVQDVRDAGVPVVTTMVILADGTRMGSYAFGDPIATGPGSGSRKAIPKKVKTGLLERTESRCGWDGTEMLSNALQVEHRVPFGVSSAAEGDWDLDDFGLACGSCNMAKKKACGECPNFRGAKDPDVCRSCYWAVPDDHSHVATVHRRRLDLVWDGAETALFDALRDASDESPAQTIKDLVADYIARRSAAPAS